MPRTGKDEKLYDTLVDLKRHLRSCRDCAAAQKACDPYMMCRQGLMLTLNAASQYDSVIRLRVHAHANAHGHVFACPDLSKHGKPYALTAQPLHVTAIQETMF